MKNIIATVTAFIAAVVLTLTMSASALTGCVNPTPRSIVKNVLDIAQIACVLVHDNVEDAHVLAKTCNIADDYIDTIRDLIAGRNQAKAMKAAAAASASVAAPAPSTSTKGK